jgi:hypothetical protein
MSPTVSDDFVMSQLTLLERSCRECREALCIARELATKAQKPSIEVASPGIAGRINRQLPPSPQQQVAEQARMFATKANVEMANVTGHAMALVTALRGATEEGSGDATKLN